MTGSDEGVVGVIAFPAYGVNGGRVEYSNWEIDGVSVMDMGSGATGKSSRALTPPAKSVA